MGVTTLARSYLEAATRMRMCYEAENPDAGHVYADIMKAYDEDCPYYYADMYWKIVKTGERRYDLGIHLH